MIGCEMQAIRIHILLVFSRLFSDHGSIKAPHRFAPRANIRITANQVPYNLFLPHLFFSLSTANKFYLNVLQSTVFHLQPYLQLQHHL